MKKNWFVKFICVNLSLCITMSNAVPALTGNDLRYVYASEAGEEYADAEDTKAQDADAEKTESVQTKEATMTNANENTETTQKTNTEEAQDTTAIMTQVSEIEDTDTETTDTESIKTETPAEPADTETTQTQPPVSESEESTESTLENNASNDSASSYIEALLEELRQKYPSMYINGDEYFEYVDENGVVHTYDPYDPELFKYLLDDEIVLTEDSYPFQQFNADSSGNTVSPFTKKTYIHESHVSNKIVRHGIDVSKYQGDIDWEKAKKAGVYFAFVRVGYRGYGADGKIASDDYAKKNIQKAHDAGVKVGVYFFSQAITKQEASEEADYCINFLKSNSLADYITLPVVIDYEYTSGSTKGRLESADLSRSTHQNICDRFVQDVRDAGYKGGIYANYQMLTKDMQPTSSDYYSKTQYWIARYNEATHYSDNYRFWQYASDGKVDGISGRVDCNFWYEDKRDLTKCRVSINMEVDFVTDYVDDIKEALSIYDTTNKYELTEGKDYEVAVTAQTVDGKIKYNLAVTGIGDYTGKLERKGITMTPLTLTETMIGDIAPQEYTGFAITQETGLKFEINNGNTKLTEGKDYTVSYADNINAGKGYVIVTGMGNYTGEVRKEFPITGMKLKAEMFEEIPSVIYTGAEHKTDTGVTISGKNETLDYKLVEGIDYTLKYSANKNAGTAKVTVVGKGNYAGEVALTFEILGKDFSETAVVNIGGAYDTYETAYTGKALKPNVTVAVDGKSLSKNDYMVEYGDNINIGTEAYVLVKGIKNYTGEVKKFFSIVPKAVKPTKLSSRMVSLNSTHMYTDKEGRPVQPALCVVSGTKLLEKDVDYTVSYQNKNGAWISEIKDAGEYKIIVEGIGAYTGKITKKLTLVSDTNRVLSDAFTEVTLVSEPASLVYTGKAVIPQIKVIDKVADANETNGTELVLGTDYKVSYVDNKTAGTARIVVKGKGLYKGEVTKTFTIYPKDLGALEQNTAEISLNKYSFVYNAKKQQPKIKIKDDKTTLKENRDFTVTYDSENVAEHAKDCKNVDKYTLNIAFKGNYKGTATVGYEITPADFSKVKVKISNQFYTGNEICLELEDMEIKLGSVKLDKKALESVPTKDEESADEPTEPVEDEPTKPIEDAPIFGVTIDNWHDNINAGKAGFRMTTTEQCRNFTGGIIKDITFKIVKKPVKNLEITVGGFAVSAKNKCDLKLVYNDGIEYNQSNGAEVVVKDADTGATLDVMKDYTVKFSNNKNAGNAKVKISGIGGYSGSRTVTFQIVGKPFNDTCRIELSKDSYVYNNSERKPSVTLYYGSTRLKNGSDYTVKYENNVNAGTAKAVVTGKGKYSGTLTKTFTILPKEKTKDSKVTVSSIADQKYTGSVIVPNVTVTVDGLKLVKGKDYTVSVLNSTRLTYTVNKQRRGIATMIITGVGNYKGTLAKRSFVVIEK